MSIIVIVCLCVTILKTVFKPVWQLGEEKKTKKKTPLCSGDLLTTFQARAALTWQQQLDFFVLRVSLCCAGGAGGDTEGWDSSWLKDWWRKNGEGRRLRKVPRYYNITSIIYRHHWDKNNSGHGRFKRQFKCFLNNNKRLDKNPQSVPGGAGGPRCRGALRKECSQQPPRSSVVQYWVRRVLLSQIDTLNKRSEYARLDHRISFQTFDSSSCFLAWQSSQTGWSGLHERWRGPCTAKTGSGFLMDTNNTPRCRGCIYTTDVWKNKTHQKYLKCFWSQEYIFVCLQTDPAAQPLYACHTNRSLYKCTKRRFHLHRCCSWTFRYISERLRYFIQM